MENDNTQESEKVGSIAGSVTEKIGVTSRVTTHVNITGNFPRLFDRPTIDFLNLVLESAFIPNAKILSTLLITLPSLGKTTYLELTEAIDFVHYTNDISPKPLMEFLDEVEKGRKKFLVIPDYINTLGHGKNTVENTRSILRSMIEEGYKSSDYYGMQREYDHPVKAGLISGITVDKANENTGRWRSDGFYSRLLPWSYSHSLPTSESIVEDKLNGARPIREVKFKINKNPQEPTLDELMKMKAKVLSLQLTQDKYVGAIYRPLEQVLSLVRSSAVLRDSNKVEQEDIDKVMRLSVYINRMQNPI
jgi:hypothetical protein